MKKTYVLTHPKRNLARIIEAAKHDAKKYIKREKGKTLPTGTDFWDFDCKYGANEAEAEVIHVSQINACMDKAEKLELPSFYLEILARAEQRPAKSFDADENSEDESSIE
ncbi:DUF6172 family protein [Agarivorans sp. MS3-6]|uniref:DUF6172 family protein n=1 Tax=Agarivorans sp. TSD2052 TaxID=2937286 RepID=UPI00200CB51B|nr:DUF6172 family protein [Agarivorans sp. TSD2052]UPW18647.1 DUF6172 family protein [Agarivorans sp. TSD2052]